MNDILRTLSYLNPLARPIKTGRRDYNPLSVELVRQMFPRHFSLIDVGSRNGDLYLQLSPHPNSNHFLIEPIQAFSEILRKRFPQATVIEAAIADRCAEKVSFYLSSPDGSLSSLRKDSVLDLSERMEVQVPLRTLDSFTWPIKIDFLKIDVEGAETLVIKGAKSFLTTHSPIILFEHGYGLYERFDLHGLEIFDDLTSLGYSIYPLSIHLFDCRPLSRLEFRISTRRAIDYMFIARRTVLTANATERSSPS